MPNTRSPRHGSMQFWPRVRAKSTVARIRSWDMDTKDSLLGFIGYKVGMTHIIGIDTRKNAATKGEEISMPVTVIECPPLKVAGIRLYKLAYRGSQPSTEIMFKTEKDLSRKLTTSKKPKETSELDSIKADDYSDARILVYTQPRMTGIAKKKPEFIEVGIKGSVTDKIKFAKEHQELPVATFFKEGESVDIHAITKGKGLQGPVKRFGVPFKPHKSEKGVRRVGTLGAWSAQGHTLYRVPHPGQMGYHMRTELNKQIVKIGTKPEEVNPLGGWPHYGLVRGTFILIKGSIAGSQKRAIIFTKSIRKPVQDTAPTITEISLRAK